MRTSRVIEDSYDGNGLSIVRKDKPDGTRPFHPSWRRFHPGVNFGSQIRKSRGRGSVNLSQIGRSRVPSCSDVQCEGCKLQRWCGFLSLPELVRIMRTEGRWQPCGSCRTSLGKRTVSVTPEPSNFRDRLGFSRVESGHAGA